MDFIDPNWTVLPVSITSVLQAAEHFGVDSSHLLGLAGLDAAMLQDPESRLPASAYYKLYRLAVEASGNPNFALAVGRITFLRGLNLQLYMSTICDTFREYLKYMPSTMRMRGDLGHIKTQLDGDLVRLIWKPLSPDSCQERLLSDEMLAASVHIINSLCISPVPIVNVRFTYKKPINIKELKGLFGNDIKFGQAESYLSFKREALNYQLVKPDYDYQSSPSSTIQRLFDTSTGTDAVLDSLREAIANSLLNGEVGIDLIAAKLTVSRRTLQRRLSDRGTNFQQVLQDVRYQMATSYLADGRLSITEIAFLLGYSDQASFSSAFKSWNGQSPSEYCQS